VSTALAVTVANSHFSCDVPDNSVIVTFRVPVFTIDSVRDCTPDLILIGDDEPELSKCSSSAFSPVPTVVVNHAGKHSGELVV